MRDTLQISRTYQVDELITQSLPLNSVSHLSWGWEWATRVMNVEIYLHSAKKRVTAFARRNCAQRFADIVPLASVPPQKDTADL